MKATTVKVNYCVVDVDCKSVHLDSLNGCIAYVDKHGVDHPRRPLTVCVDIPGAFVVYPQERFGEMLTNPGRLLSPQDICSVSSTSDVS